MNLWARLLRLMFRVVGALAMTAIVAVFMPRAWIDWCHQQLGMGPFPTGPVPEYLARSESLLYAVLGAMLWALSGSIDRMPRAIRGVGLGLIAAGLIFFYIDYLSGLPWWWQAGEGASTAIMGGVVLFLSAKARQDKSQGDK
jgi:hypothetical protein